MNHAAAIDTDETHTTGQRIRLIRKAQGKSLLQVIDGLAGIGKSTLHRIEHGQRDVTLSEIVALANALEITPAKLIRLPILTPANGRPSGYAKPSRPCRMRRLWEPASRR